MISFLDALPIRENVVRVEFSEAVHLTRLYEAIDAARPEKWTMTPDTTTIGYSGDVARAVGIADVALATEEDGIEEADLGRFVNVTLDRPMTPFPASYTLEWVDIYAADQGSTSSGTAIVLATYRLLTQPQVDVVRPTRDFANPQLFSDATVSVGDPFSLGTFGVADDGDYAFDEGLASLKKRVIRRLITKKGAFAHLPEYGVGIPYEGKKLGTTAVLSRLSGEAEAQLRREPDVAQAKVTPFLDSERPGLVFFRIVVRQRAGNPVAFEVPFKKGS